MLLAGFAILGTTQPDFYRGSATGIPRNNWTVKRELIIHQENEVIV